MLEQNTSEDLIRLYPSYTKFSIFYKMGVHIDTSFHFTGSSRSHWSCYFFAETSTECQKQAFSLMKSQEAWQKQIITVKDNYTSKEIWAGKVPRYTIPHHLLISLVV